MLLFNTIILTYVITRKTATNNIITLLFPPYAAISRINLLTLLKSHIDKTVMTNRRTRAYKGIYPTLGEKVYIDESSVIVGDIDIANDVSIWPLVAARGDVNKITIGERTNIQDGTVLHVTRKTSANPDGHPLVIGDDVTVGHKCMLHGCQLGNRILVGMGAIIMDGAIVQDDVFIGAGTLVPPNKTLESGYLYVGNPAKQARPLKESEQAFLKQSAENYVVLKDEYLSFIN